MSFSSTNKDETTLSYPSSIFSFSITDRLSHAADLPFEVFRSGIVHPVVSVAGVAASALSVLTLGLSKNVNNIAGITSMSRKILPPIYANILKIIHPNADTTSEFETQSLLTRKFALPIFDKAKNLASDNSILSKHVLSRGAYLLGGIVAVVTRVADLAIGCVAAVFSFITLGMIEKVNHFAYSQLGSLGVIDDVCVSIRGFINPQQFQLERPGYNNHSSNEV